MQAFGAPGIAPTWTSSSKDMVGCALGPARLWFTSGFGILNEVYYPRVDIPQIRDLGFIVADDRGFWVEVKRLNSYRTYVPHVGVPALEIVHCHSRFELSIRIAPDPLRDVVLVEVTLQGDEDLRPYALVAPHLGGTGRANFAEISQHHGRRILSAEQGPFALALAAVGAGQVDAWQAVSAGYVGASDGWQDFKRNGRLRWRFEVAGPGNVALIGELPRKATLALGFGSSREAAATLAISSLCQPFADVWERHEDAWRRWQRRLHPSSGLPAKVQEQMAISAMVLRVHQDKTYPGAMVASLSIPWGNTSDDIGGYHLVWPRDLVESAGGLLALGALPEAREILRYLIASQLQDGNWPQNQWLGGKPYWQGNQLDETAFPVLLAVALSERRALDGIEVTAMVQSALGFIARNGPASEQDRWEEDAGINTFTLATCIAALVCGAPWLDPSARDLALRLADDWNSRIENWTVVGDTRLAHTYDVVSYYVRIAPPPLPGAMNRLGNILPIKNHIRDPGIPAREQVATDFLQLVRLGLRDAHNPIVLNTLKVIDGELKVETPVGPSWHRYTGDGYGEKADGRPFDGTGHGRAWPLLTGERGHYEVAAGRDPLPYLLAMSAMAGRCGLIPEQIWDTPSLPERLLEIGKPTGAVMPLVWAHAEFIKLVASRFLGRPFDRPEALWRRYGGRRPDPKYAIWTARSPISAIREGQILCICLPDSARIHYGTAGWQQVADVETIDSGLGLHYVDLPMERLTHGRRIEFTFYWDRKGAWEGRNYAIEITPSAG
jgi:glucoamylase